MESGAGGYALDGALADLRSARAVMQEKPGEVSFRVVA